MDFDGRAPFLDSSRGATYNPNRRGITDLAQASRTTSPFVAIFSEKALPMPGAHDEKLIAEKYALDYPRRPLATHVGNVAGIGQHSSWESSWGQVSTYIKVVLPFGQARCRPTMRLSQRTAKNAIQVLGNPRCVWRRSTVSGTLYPTLLVWNATRLATIIPAPARASLHVRVAIRSIGPILRCLPLATATAPPVMPT